jgi:hypothetical protein
MQGPTASPTEGDEASFIPTDHGVRNGSQNLNRTLTIRRKAAKRILAWDLPTIEEIQLALPRPQDEHIHKTKRPRLEKLPFLTAGKSTDEAST